MSGEISAPVDLTDRLALHLPLTTDLKDHSPQLHAVEVVGAVRITEEGAYFGGRKDWLEAPHVALDSRPFAVALWIKEAARNRQVGLVEQYDLPRPGHHFHLMLRENRQPYLGFLVHDQISPVGIPWEQEWMHLVFQYTGEFQQIWINGHLVVRRRTEPYLGTTGVTTIGKAPRWNNVPAKDFVGFMRDVRIYQRLLVPEEIVFLHNPSVAAAARSAVARRAGVSPPSEISVAPMPQALAALLPENPALPFLEIDGQTITVNGRPGQVYLLQASNDLETWLTLDAATNTTGTLVYVEAERAEPMRFYRVQMP
jgi:hypothetical protein